MAFTAQQNYQATEVRTAPPQKLQLMLIECALLMANRAKQAWSEGCNDVALKSLMRAQKILAEMMSTVDLDAGHIVKNVLAIDEFIYRNLVRAGSYRDEKALADAIRVLERERDNWRLVCEKLSTARRNRLDPGTDSKIPTPHFARFSDFDTPNDGGFSIDA